MENDYFTLSAGQQTPVSGVSTGTSSELQLVGSWRAVWTTAAGCPGGRSAPGRPCCRSPPPHLLPISLPLIFTQSPSGLLQYRFHSDKIRIKNAKSLFTGIWCLLCQSKLKYKLIKSICLGFKRRNVLLFKSESDITECSLKTLLQQIFLIKLSLSLTARLH